MQKTAGEYIGTALTLDAIKQRADKMTQTDIILEVKDLCVEFRTAEGTVQAVDHLSYVLHKGEKLGIVGESGSGKSVSSLGMMQLIPNPPGQIQEERFYTLEGIW